MEDGKDKNNDDAQFSEWLGLIIDDKEKAEVLKAHLKEKGETERTAIAAGQVRTSEIERSKREYLGSPGHTWVRTCVAIVLLVLVSGAIAVGYRYVNRLPITEGACP